MALLDLNQASTRDLIRVSATRSGVEAALVAALMLQESGGNPWAVRAEPGYRWVWDVRRHQAFRTLTAQEATSPTPPQDFYGPMGASRATEWTSQRMSWGLLQVMGAVAREHGFKGPFLSSLLDPGEGLTYGCALLAALGHRWGAQGLQAVVSAYNAGRPTEANRETYVEPVLRLLTTTRPLFGA